MSTTKEVLDNHLKSFFAGDLEAVLADYEPGAVFFVPGGPLVGVDAIRPCFVALLAEFAKPVATFRLVEQHVHGDGAYILWTAETADNRHEFATDTFVIRDGRIRVQSFGGLKRPKA